MMKAVAINGSPRNEKGNTATVLAPFVQGMQDAGCEVEQVYASQLKIEPCSCGSMRCWNTSPGACIFHDDMDQLLPRVKAADILVLASPVYSPLPGNMQNFINRLCPLLEPRLELRDGRTRARFRQDVNIQKIVLVATCGWWEKANFDTMVRIVKELAENAGTKFAGSVLRPHAGMLKSDGKVTKDGEAILNAVWKAGYELIREGGMKHETLETICKPLISEEEIRKRYSRSF